jgi:hypothetical protein
MPKNENVVCPGVVLKPVPVRVTTVPALPTLGEIPVTVGNTSKANLLENGALVMPSTVTVTGTAPTGCSGLVMLQYVVPTQKTPVASTPPNDTVVFPLFRLTPFRAMNKPPVVGPTSGLMLVIAGPSYVNWSSIGNGEVEKPHGVSATMFTFPGACAGLTMLHDVWVEQETLVALLPPNSKVRASDNAIPLTVTVVPPSIGPVVGATKSTMGL